MKRVLFVDPGEKCGWVRAVVDDQGNWSEVRHGITAWKPFVLSLFERQAKFDRGYDVIGYEVFRLYRTHALQQIGSDMQTSQCIGAIRLIGWLSGVRVVSQGANVKRTARGSAPRWLKDYLAAFPKAHDEAHDEDALLHLWAWTFKNYDVDPRRHRADITSKEGKDD